MTTRRNVIRTASVAIALIVVTAGQANATGPGLVVSAPTVVDFRAPGEGTWDAASTHQSVSDDGRYVVFGSTPVGPISVPGTIYVKNMVMGTAQRGPEGWDASISGDGRYVAFIAPYGGMSRSYGQIVVWDRWGHVERLVSVNLAGDPSVHTDISAPRLSRDGRYVTFSTDATDLVTSTAGTKPVRHVYVRDMMLDTTTLVSAGPGGTLGDGSSSDPVISANGRYVAYTSAAGNLSPNLPLDRNGKLDVYSWDRLTGANERVSVGEGAYHSPIEGDGNSGVPDISETGQFVVFASHATNFGYGAPVPSGDVYVRDTYGATTERIGSAGPRRHGQRFATNPSISRDGRYVAFESTEPDLDPVQASWPAPRYPNVFVRDRLVGSDTLVNLTHTGKPTNGNSRNACFDGTGTRIVFTSHADNLLANDPNGWYTNVLLVSLSRAVAG